MTRALTVWQAVRDYRGRWFLVFALFFAAVAIHTPGSHICTVSAEADTSPNDYCFRLDIGIVNSGSTLTDYPVRVLMNALSLVTQDQMDPRAWDIRPTLGAFSNTVDLSAQDLTSGNAAWWYYMESLPAGESRTVRNYLGNSEQKRDQGIQFSGGEVVQVAHDAAFNINNELRLTVVAELVDATARDESLIEHRNIGSSAGYAIELVDAASVLNIRAWVDGSTVQATWDAAWTDTPQEFRLDYDDPVLTLYRNGSSIASLGIGVGNIGGATTALKIGDSLSGTIIREASVVSGFASTPVLIARYGFDAASLAELTAVDPTYTGTFSDYSANALDGTYTFTRSQANLAVTVNALTLTSSPSTAALPATVLDILGGPFVSTVFTPVPENINAPFYEVFAPPASIGIPRQMWWVMILTTIGLFLAVTVHTIMRNVFYSLFAAALPLGYGSIYGFIEMWWLIAWAALFISLYGAHQWRERS